MTGKLELVDDLYIGADDQIPVGVGNVVQEWGSSALAQDDPAAETLGWVWEEIKQHWAESGLGEWDWPNIGGVLILLAVTLFVVVSSTGKGRG